MNNRVMMLFVAGYNCNMNNRVMMLFVAGYTHAITPAHSYGHLIDLSHKQAHTRIY